MAILTADVGGTNTRVALCDPETLRPSGVRRFVNAQFESLSDVLRTYASELPEPPRLTAACVAVAGPVRNGSARLTNLDWSMDSAMLCDATGAPRGFVINDLEAQGHALSHVETSRIRAGSDPTSIQPRLVVGLGTGFNAAPVHPAGGGAAHVVASECGHVSLPVWDSVSYAVAQGLVTRHGFASIEEVLSGRGLLALHGHFATAIDDRLTSTNEIITRMSDAPRPADRQTADFFCGLLGRVLGDLALVHLPWSGIFLIGGLARAMVPFLPNHGFEDGFLAKGRFSGFVRDFSVFVVEDDYAALTGCAEYAVRGADGALSISGS